MYSKYPEGEMTLWCHGRSDEEEVRERSGRKRDSTKRQEKEAYVDEIYKDLKDK